MSFNDELGKRMKSYYENISKNKLMKRTPVALRIDGKAFHTFTKGMNKPFDSILISTMQETMKYLCENITGAVIGYTQSDEITIILQDYKTFSTKAWFDYEVQKLCSVSASIATMAFNKFFQDNISNLTPELKEPYINKVGIAMFDSRCFNIPKEEVTNLLYWRQLDAIRNSIQMVAQANFPHKRLQNKSCNQLQDLLMTEKNINWNDLPTYKKQGSCCIKDTYIHINEATGVEETRSRWIIDLNIPQFKDEGRKYIESRINFPET